MFFVLIGMKSSKEFVKLSFLFNKGNLITSTIHGSLFYYWRGKKIMLN